MDIVNGVRKVERSVSSYEGEASTVGSVNGRTVSTLSVALPVALLDPQAAALCEPLASTHDCEDLTNASAASSSQSKVEESSDMFIQNAIRLFFERAQEAFDELQKANAGEYQKKHEAWKVDAEAINPKLHQIDLTECSNPEQKDAMQKAWDQAEAINKEYQSVLSVSKLRVETSAIMLRMAMSAPGMLRDWNANEGKSQKSLETQLNALRTKFDNNVLAILRAAE